MPERRDLLLAERSPGGHRNVAQALQHDPPTQRPRLSSPGTAQLDHGCLERHLPSPARSSLRPDYVGRPGSDDELAPLGLDSVLAGLLNLIRRRRKILKDWPNHQACCELYSLCRTGTKHRGGHYPYRRAGKTRLLSPLACRPVAVSEEHALDHGSDDFFLFRVKPGSISGEQIT